MASGRGKASRRAANPSGKRVKKSNLPAALRRSRERACEEVERHCYSSSFPRKRESSLAASQEKHRRVFRTAALDSRFRGNDEVLFDGYCLLQCRYFRDPTVVVGAVRSFHTLFRRNDKVLSGRYGPLLRYFFGVPAIVVSALRFLRTLFRGNDGVFVGGRFPAQRRFPGAPVAIMRNIAFFMRPDVRRGGRDG